MNKIWVLLGVLSITVLLSGCIGISEGNSDTRIDELNVSVESVDTTGGDPLYNDRMSVSVVYSIDGSHDVTGASVGFYGYNGTVSVDDSMNSTEIRLSVSLTEEQEMAGDQFGYELGIHLSNPEVKVQTSDGKHILKDELSFKNVNSGKFYLTLTEGHLYATREKLQEKSIHTQGIDTTIYANSRSGIISSIEQKIQRASSVVDRVMSADEFKSRQVYVSVWKHESTTPAFVVDRNRDSEQFVYYTRSSIYTDDPTLYHEFIHNYQLYETTSEVKWIIEASAEYGGAVLASEQSDEEDIVRDEISMNTSNSSYLANPNTWTDLTNYNIGGQLMYKIDSEIRSQSQYTIFELMNRLVKYDEVGWGQFYSELAKLTSQDFASEVRDNANSKQFYIPEEQINISSVKNDSE